MRFGVQIPARAGIWIETCTPSELSYDEYTPHLPHNISTMSVIQWEDETVRERTGQPPSYRPTVAKKMKSLTLHTHGCPTLYRLA